VAYCEADAPGESQWHLFNDFLVMPLTKADALTFGTWKVPCVLCFQLKEADGNNKVNSEWKNELDTSILYEEPTLRYAVSTVSPLNLPCTCVTNIVI
jgi:PAB-dependent poly(A)-specific ribonuclease subunit 2